MTFLLYCDTYENLLNYEYMEDAICGESNSLFELQKIYEDNIKIYKSFGISDPEKEISFCVVEKWMPHELKKISGYNNMTIVYNELNVKDYY